MVASIDNSVKHGNDGSTANNVIHAWQPALAIVSSTAASTANGVRHGMLSIIYLQRVALATAE